MVTEQEVFGWEIRIKRLECSHVPPTFLNFAHLVVIESLTLYRIRSYNQYHLLAIPATHTHQISDFDNVEILCSHLKNCPSCIFLEISGISPKEKTSIFKI